MWKLFDNPWFFHVRIRIFSRARHELYRKPIGKLAFSRELNLLNLTQNTASMLLLETFTYAIKNVFCRSRSPSWIPCALNLKLLVTTNRLTTNRLTSNRLITNCLTKNRLESEGRLHQQVVMKNSDYNNIKIFIAKYVYYSLIKTILNKNKWYDVVTFHFFNNCFLRLLDTELWNELERIIWMAT